MILGILKEGSNENRASLMPEHVSQIKNLGISAIWVESDAGATVYQSDDVYAQNGASVKTRAEILSGANMILCIHPPKDKFKAGTIIITQMNPLANKALVSEMQADKLSVFSLDMVPRTTKAQAMDVLSSMATAAGYKAILEAASHLPRFFPMFMTAAGTIAPSKVLILGAGVAGLQAISTARRLGAVVEAFDVRSAAKEEVLSLGAKFVEVEGATDDTSAGGYAVEQTEEYKQKQAALIQEHAKKADVIICTAQIPGRTAPLLVTEETVKSMKSGSVIVDLAASTGGNCAFTKDNEIVIVNGVKIIGNSNLASTIPSDASKMYGKNLINFLKEVYQDETFSFDFGNDIIQHSCVVHQGEIISPRVKNIFENKQ